MQPSPALSLEQRIANLSPEKRALLEIRLQENNPRLASQSRVILPCDRTRPLPLSFAQQRLWFLNQLQPDETAYNSTSAYRINGALHLTALQQALDEIVCRHESLRTTFAEDNGTAIQIVNPPRSVPLVLLNLADWSRESQEQEWQRQAQLENRRPFDLTRDLLRRFTLIRLASEEYILLATNHHIASDGWSGGVFWRELTALYAAFAQGRPSPLPPLPIQYADYATWQRQTLQGDKLATHLRYWQEQLAGAPALLNLPLDFPRPAEQKALGELWRFALPNSLSEAIKTLARQTETTLFMTLLAAFQVLLLRYTNQSDIVVGSPIANRQRPELEGMIGMFVNTLVLRTDLGGNPTFRQLLKRVRNVAFGAYEHQDLPFERLVEALQPERNLSYHPLFQVTFSLQNMPSAEPTLANVQIERLPLDNETAKYDIAIALKETPTGIVGQLEYNTALFTPATMERFTNHFETLLTNIVADPDCAIEQYPLLSVAERHHLLTTWNRTTCAVPQEQCLHQLFEAQVEQTPEKVALIASDGQLTYRQVNARANQLAHFLRTAGVAADVPVAVCLEGTCDMVVALLAVLKAGGAYVPIDPTFPAERIGYLLGDTGTQVLLTQSNLIPQLASSPQFVVHIDTDWGHISTHCAENLTVPATATQLAYILYTSGSTGKPKGVMVEHRQVLTYVYAILQECVPLASSCAMLQPLTVDSSVTMLFPPLLTGGVLHLLTRQQALDAQQLSQYFQRHRIDCLKIAPSHLAALQASVTPAAIMPLQRLIIGGESSRWAWVKELQTLSPSCQVFNHYGPTETTVGVLVYPVDETALSNRYTTTPLGYPLAHSQVYVLDRHQQPQPIGVVGELYIGGDNVARGYLNQPALTAERFIANPFAAGRLYRTGDLARYLPNGAIEFLGRLDDQVKIRGFRVELGEIEANLAQHPAVAHVAVLARPGQHNEQVIVAYVVLAEGAGAEGKEQEIASTFYNFLRQRLPAYMLPMHYIVLAELPHTPHGKIDRNRLLAIELKEHGVTAKLAPRNPTEEMLAQIWCELLGRTEVGIHDNFFTLGGHSLLAIRLFAMMRTVFAVTLPLRHLFVTPTVAGLAEQIAQLQLVQRVTSVNSNNLSEYEEFIV